MRCTNCGNEINNIDMRFCDNCGTALSNVIEMNTNKQVDFLSGKEKILFNLFFEEYCENRIKSKESHLKIQKKAKILGISDYDLEQYLLEFLDRVEKINAYIASGFENSEEGLNEDEVYLFASDYGFDDEQANALIQERSYAQARKWMVEQDKKAKESIVKFKPIEINLPNRILILPGLCQPVKVLGEASFEIASNYKEFEQKLKVTKDLSYKNVKKMAMQYFDVPLTQFYNGLEKYGLLRECDKIGVENFKANVYRFEPLLEDEEYLKYRRKEVLEELFTFIRTMLEDEIIGLWWPKEYVGFVNCINNYEKSLLVVDEIKKCQKATEEKIEEIVKFIREGTYYSEVYIYLAELLGFSEDEEIEFLEGLQKYIIEAHPDCIKINEHLDKKYNLIERRSVADIILVKDKSNSYMEGMIIEYSSDSEAEEAKKQREIIKALFEKIDYSSNKTFYPVLKRMENIYDTIGLGQSLITEVKEQCAIYKTVKDLELSKSNELIDSTKEILYDTLDEAYEAKENKETIIKCYNECSFNSDEDVNEAINKIKALYEKSKVGEKILKHCNLRYEYARSLNDVVVNENGEIVTSNEVFVYDTIQERNYIKEQLDRVIELFVGSKNNKSIDVLQAYEQVQDIVEHIRLGKDIKNVLKYKVEKLQEKLTIYDYTTDYCQGNKERSLLAKTKVRRIVKSEEEAQDVQKKVDSIPEIYQMCNLEKLESVKNAIDKVQVIHMETECGKDILDELLYRYHELDEAKRTVLGVLYATHEEAELEAKKVVGNKKFNTEVEAEQERERIRQEEIRIEQERERERQKQELEINEKEQISVLESQGLTRARILREIKRKTFVSEYARNKEKEYEEQLWNDYMSLKNKKYSMALFVQTIKQILFLSTFVFGLVCALGALFTTIVGVIIIGVIDVLLWKGYSSAKTEIKHLNDEKKLLKEIETLFVVQNGKLELK